jgi:D-alanyl-D-alanine dipeptidase
MTGTERERIRAEVAYREQLAGSMNRQQRRAYLRRQGWVSADGRWWHPDRPDHTVRDLGAAVRIALAAANTVRSDKNGRRRRA